MALATVHYTGGVLRNYRFGQPWLVLEGVSDHYVATTFAAEVRRFEPALRLGQRLEATPTSPQPCGRPVEAP